MKIDIEALRARNQGRRDRPHEAAPSADDTAAHLLALEEAQAEVRRLKDDYADLLASSHWWADLYAAGVDRANAAEAMLGALRQVPGELQRYYRLVDAVRVLAEALEHTVLDCAECAAGHAGAILDRARDRWCSRCAKAVEALRSTVDLRL